MDNGYVVSLTETAGDVDGNVLTDDTGDGVDSDPEGDTLTVVGVGAPDSGVGAPVAGDNGGLFTINADGTVDFDANGEFDDLGLGETASTSVTYTISDGNGGFDTATATFTVTGINDGTVEGTAGNDLIDGSYAGDPNGDFVDNNDAILPGDTGNDDLIYGYGGDDSILAGDGNDDVFGGVGNDTIDGGTGDDTIFGGLGDDSIAGGDGDDMLLGREGDDTLDGGAGNDMLFGFTGNDVLIGGAGDDKLEGSSGEDTLTGGDGNDDLWAGLDNDTVYGGMGDDTVGAGEGDDIVFGGQGDDTVYGGAGDDIVGGGVGDFDDVLYGDDGNDLVMGGDGDDLAFGGAGNDTVIGGDGEDTLYGDAGNDWLEGGQDNDVAFGGTGDDLIRTNAGADYIEGGDGNDTIISTTGSGITQYPDQDYPGDGLPADPDPFDDMDTVYGGAGDDTIRTGDDADIIYGGDGNDTIDGGIDNDTIYGGDGVDNIKGGFGSDTIFGGNGGDVVVGGEDPDDSDVDVLDLTGSGVDYIDYVDGDPEAGTVYFLDGTTMTFSEIENVIPCFTPGTTIATPKGERLVEELQVGDRIITRDNGIQEIAWVGHKEMSGKQLVKNPHLRPILIKAGSLGQGLPERDMMVSPNHRVLVASEMTQLYFEEREVLAAAKHMVGSNGIHAVDVMSTTYIHFMFERHEVVLSNGAWTESFQPGDYSLKGIGNSQRNEIFELFPELATQTGLEGYQSARKALKKHEAKLLLK